VLKLLQWAKKKELEEKYTVSKPTYAEAPQFFGTSWNICFAKER